MKMCLAILAAALIGAAAPSSKWLIPCAEISSESLGVPDLRITRAALVTGEAPYPDYCLVQGKARERTGIDGRSYAIGFEMRLPVATFWNGRFLQQANGGTDGTVTPAVGVDNGNGGVTALQRGFAVLSTDGGHDGADPANASFGLAQGVAFGLDPQARIDYGYGANERLAPIAKYVIARFYGKLPFRSYMMGCSNGGRQGMVAATRIPWAYDGILAGDPGFNLPKATVQHAWDVQSWLIANPDIRQAFSQADLDLVSAKVVQACDGLDGVTDGMVNDVAACQRVFHLSELRCPGDKKATCLSASQIAALTRSFGGPRNSRGAQLYSDWPFDSGLGGSGWRFWKLESPIPPWNNLPLIATMGAGALSYVFTTPPVTTPGTPDGLLGFLANFDFDRDAPKIFATDSTFTQSAMQFMTPTDVAHPRMAEFKSLGHKMIVYHGQSDPVFSYNDTASWYSALSRNHHGNADSFVRFFSVPGMNHCGGGPATDQFDALTALVNWVEKGVAPDRLLATVSPANTEVPATWSPSRSRPLCPFPKIAVYNGSGDVDSAASFSCRAPK
jgi:feruloyl esterase